MRVLLTNVFPPRAAAALRQRGHEAVHVTEIGLDDATEDEIREYAGSDDRLLFMSGHDILIMLL